MKEARNAKKGRKEEQARQAAAVATPPPPPAPAPPAPTALLGPATGINADWIRDVASAVTKEFNAAGLAQGGLKQGVHWDLP